MEKVFITGASSGIGEALAQLLQKKGVPLLLTGRDVERLKVFGEPYLPCDLADSASRKKLFEWALSHEPTVWVNNAGFGFYGPFEQLTASEMDSMIAVNITALTEGTHHALQSYIKRGKGTILNVASMAAHFPFPYGALYGATKAYVYQLSRSLDAECRSKGARVLCSLPGVVQTSFQQRASKGGPLKKYPLQMDVHFAAEQLLWQIESGKGVHGFDWRYRLLQKIQTILPTAVSEWVISRSLKKR